MDDDMTDYSDSERAQRAHAEWAELEDAKRAAKRTIADFFDREKVLALESPDKQTIELLRLLAAIELFRPNLVAWAREEDIL
jgi:hypothetical protein